MENMKKMKKGIYILPSLFTLGNLAMGFFSIIAGMHGHFAKAAWCIFFAGIFDALDGRVARMTNTTSNFGIELDSICDMVSFGVAPALLVYNFCLFKYTKWGIIVCLLYIIAAALRLARFNTITCKNKEDSYFFKGLPSPAAADMLASFVLIYMIISNNNTSKTLFPIFMDKVIILYRFLPILVILVSYAMISNISYMSLKNLKLGKPKTMHQIIMICIAFILIWRFPENMLFIVFSMYFLSGLIGIFKKLYRASLLFKIKKTRKK